jgi:CDP-diglyceride synthetase
MTLRQQLQQARRLNEDKARRDVDAVMRDRRYDRLRTPTARRVLVATVVAGIAAIAAVTLAVGMLAAQPVILATIVAFLLLRVSVRAVADLPEQYLDERQLTLRYQVHQTAYFVLGLAAMLATGSGVVAYIAMTKDPGSDVVTLTDSHVNALFYVTAALVITLPTMILALRDAERP